MYKAHGAPKSTHKATYGQYLTREYKDIPGVKQHCSIVMDQSPFLQGVSGEYSVTLHVGKNDGEALCNCDFVDRDRMSKNSSLFIYYANYMVAVPEQKDQRPAYGRLLDHMAILFEYQLAGSSSYYTYEGADEYGTRYVSYSTGKHSATHKRNEHSTSYSDKAKSTLKDATIWETGNGRVSRTPGPGFTVQDMNQHVPLLPTAAAPDIAHVAGIADVGALAAQALSDGASQIGPKPQKRYKKIKFLDDPPQ
jgi:hypothetical protein